ncbi:MAG: chromosomal replication initiator protein DnaA [Clostridia bacterium]|nr:chromosomal replication initiator protein DnaA [Clostridia bacterium]
MDFIKQIWETVLDTLSDRYSDIVMKLWFRKMNLTHLDENNAYISVDNEHKLKIIENKYKDELKTLLEECLGFPVGISFYVEGAEELEDFFYNEPHAPNQKELESYNINYEYTFDNFVIGSSNKFTHAACLAVAKTPARAYNPLFIHGPSGLGKTHLLFAIKNEAKRLRPNLKVVYVKGEDFTNQLVDAIAEKKPIIFREKYRNCDMLLVDDVQFIAGKEATQEEFFHTFNALYEQSKQIILTSDRPPKDIKDLNDRIKTRFESGLITDITPPDYELRAAILKRKATIIGIDLPQEVVAFLAESIRSNVRQLEGAVKKLSAFNFINKVPITVELAKDILVDVMSGDEPTSVTVDKVLLAVSNKYNIDRDELFSKKRNSEIVKARNVSIYLIKTLTDMTLVAIGRMFNRDHSTIVNSLSNIEKEIKSSSDFAHEIEEINEDIRSLV